MADYTYGNLDPRYVDAIRQFEGFTPRAKWDVRQNSNGYGTRARYPGEVIDKAEAERRLHEELTRAAGIVDSYASNLDPGTRAALASLTYNSGGDWMKAGLGQAVRAGDWDAARQSFGQYTKAGGQHLPGLANRRNAELGWFGVGAGATQPAQGQPQPGPVQATYPFPAPMALGAPREPVQAPSEVLAQNYGSGAPQPSSALQWDTGAFWAGKAAESKADGGPVPTADEILAAYSDPVGQFHHKLLEKAPIVPPWDRPGTKSPVTGTLSNPPDRPSDWAVKSGVAETVSPTMGAYGVGSILGEVAGATKAGNLGEAGMNALPLGAMFLGPGAKTANKTNMLRAQEMHAKGLPREAIWKDTGWFQGVDGKWRYEIDDSKSFTKGGDLPMSESANRWGPTAGGVVHHPDMMAAYPEIADVHMKGSKDTGGSYVSGLLRDPVLSVDDQLRGKKKHSVALHEFQHGVQDLENFASGANENFGHKRDDVRAAARDAYNANREAAKRPPTADDLLLDELGIKPPNVSKPWEELTPRQQLEWSDAGRGRLYRNSAGEVEARTVQKRMNMTPEERAARPPWLDYDVPEGQQIVRYGDGGPQASASGSFDPPRLEPRPMDRSRLHEIASAQYTTPYALDPVQNVPLSSLKGGHFGPEKVAPLANEIKANGWIEPMVVDGAGNIIEGQHRLRALQQLGVTDAPVHRIREILPPETANAIQNAAKETGIHREQASSITREIAQIIDKEGIGELSLYDPPRGFEKAWSAAVSEAQKRMTAPQAQASASGPLDMSPEARKARAEDLGFDTAKTWHHGTRADVPFDAFKTGLPTKNNLGMLGNVDTTRSATFLTDNSGFASEYGKHVSPYHARGNVIPLTRDIRLNFADSIDPFGPDRDLWSSIKHGRNDWELFDGKVGERFKKWSKDNGIDGYRFSEWIDRASGDGEVGGETLAIFDPKNIRSVNAAFDPAHSNSANLMRSVFPGAVVAGGTLAAVNDPKGYANGGAVHRALKVAEKSVNRTPSDAQKEAGNYAKGHLTYKGLNVTIENPKDSERSGMGRDGKRWSVKMPSAYGYVKSTEGYDGDHVDVYLGPDHDSDKVFVVDQIDAETGKFDEHKCFLSFANKNSALNAYRKAFSDGKASDRIGAVTEMTMDRFKSWVKSPGTKVPLGDIRKGYADGGPVPTADEILSEYSDPVKQFHHKFNEGPPVVAPWDRPNTRSPVTGTLTNYERPADWAVKSGVAEMASQGINPMVMGHGLGSAIGEVAGAAKAGDYGHIAGIAAPMAAMAVVPMGPKGMKKPPALDNLGYYSGALESARNLPQAKGTPQQMLAMMQKGGAKAGEIEATGLNKFLEGRPSVTRDEIVNHLEGSRIGLNERVYDRSPPNEVELSRMRRNNGTPDDILAAELGIGNDPAAPLDRTHWSRHSLDPSNPTYRETVLHLPEGNRVSFDEFKARYNRENPGFSDEQLRRSYDGLNAAKPDLAYEQEPFRSGHFPEPNIVGHMMTSMNKTPDGKKVFTLDQIQSDWGQKLRDAGVRDEAKIAELGKTAAAAEKSLFQSEGGAAWLNGVNELSATNGLDRVTSYQDAYKNLTKLLGMQRSVRDEAQKLHASMRDNPASSDFRRIYAELKTAEQGAVGHPLVNTTDQWTNTTLRRALQQAIDAKADHVAIPTGDTVLSYNPGDTAGMHGFYGRGPRQQVNVGADLQASPGAQSRAAMEGIVPKNLRKMLLNIDRDHPGGTYVNQLETPSGMKGQGFTMFPITPAVREYVKKNGLPLFTAAPVAAAIPGAINDPGEGFADGGSVATPDEILAEYTVDRRMFG